MDDLPFFSGIKPNLINEKALKSIDKILNNTKNEITVTTGDHLIKIYEDYIRPNLFGIIVIVVIVAYLFIRYILKQHNINNLDNNDESDVESTLSKNTNIENQEYKKNDMDDIDIDNIDTSSLQLDNNESQTEDVDDNKSDLTELNREYNRMIRENNDQMSPQMLKDLYKQKSDKVLFNEMTRIVAQGGADE